LAYDSAEVLSVLLCFVLLILIINHPPLKTHIVPLWDKYLGELNPYAKINVKTAKELENEEVIESVFLSNKELANEDTNKQRAVFIKAKNIFQKYRNFKSIYANVLHIMTKICDIAEKWKKLGKNSLVFEFFSILLWKDVKKSGFVFTLGSILTLFLYIMPLRYIILFGGEEYE
jgi:hypothetical protein